MSSWHIASEAASYIWGDVSQSSDLVDEGVAKRGLWRECMSNILHRALQAGAALEGFKSVVHVLRTHGFSYNAFCCIQSAQVAVRLQYQLIRVPCSRTGCLGRGHG